MAGTFKEHDAPTVDAMMPVICNPMRPGYRRFTYRNLIFYIDGLPLHLWICETLSNEDAYNIVLTLWEEFNKE